MFRSVRAFDGSTLFVDTTYRNTNRAARIMRVVLRRRRAAADDEVPYAMPHGQRGGQQVSEGGFVVMLGIVGVVSVLCETSVAASAVKMQKTPLLVVCVIPFGIVFVYAFDRKDIVTIPNTATCFFFCCCTPDVLHELTRNLNEVYLFLRSLDS